MINMIVEIIVLIYYFIDMPVFVLLIVAAVAAVDFVDYIPSDFYFLYFQVYLLFPLFVQMSIAILIICYLLY